MPSIEKAPALACRCDQHSGQRRPNQPRHVHHRRIDGDGIAQIGAVVHHLHHEGLAPRHVECIDDALHDAQKQNQSNRDVPGECERRQRKRLNHGQRLRPHQHLSAIEPVNPNAGEWRNKKRRNLAREAHRAQQQRRAREPVHQPRRRNARHPGADERDGLAAEEEPEVAMPQRAPDVRCAACGECFRLRTLALARSCPRAAR